MKRFINTALKTVGMLVVMSAGIAGLIFVGYSAGTNNTTETSIVWDDRVPDDIGLWVGEEYLISVIIEGGKEFTMPDGETQMIYIGTDKDNHAIRVICTNACEDANIQTGKVTEFRVIYAGIYGNYSTFSAVGIRNKNIEINWQPPRDFGQGYNA